MGEARGRELPPVLCGLQTPSRGRHSLHPGLIPLTPAPHPPPCNSFPLSKPSHWLGRRYPLMLLLSYSYTGPVPVKWFIFLFTNKSCEEAVLLLSSQSSGELLSPPTLQLSFLGLPASPITWGLPGFSKSGPFYLACKWISPPSLLLPLAAGCPLFSGFSYSPSLCSFPLNIHQFFAVFWK